ncbi:MAG: undecaprenyl-diphosphatase UppP [Candidatus Omnitrophota bacterium]
MNILQASVLGLIEGLTEFLPISSTGHLMLAVRSLGIAQTEFVKSFEIAIQSGAILAVAVMYWGTLLKSWEIGKRVLIAFVPTAVIGVIFYKFIKSFMFNNVLVVLWALFLGGIILIAFERFHREKESDTQELTEITYPKALAIGLFQTIAVIPGVSRSAATILGGLALGLKRRTIVEFSFLLALPTLISATAWDMFKCAPSFKESDFLLLSTGFIISGGVSFLSMRFLLAFVKKHSFSVFGIYRVVLAIIFWFWLGMK